MTPYRVGVIQYSHQRRQEGSNMNSQQFVSLTVVEELFKMVDGELRAHWSKRRQDADRNIQVRETTISAQKSLPKLKPELRKY